MVCISTVSFIDGDYYENAVKTQVFKSQKRNILMEENAKDFAALRRKRKRRRSLKKFLGFFILIAVVAGLYIMRDRWLPRLETVYTNRDTVEPNEGNFPISITGGIDYQTGVLDNYFVLLSDTHLYLYDVNGTLKDNRQHTYSNSVLKCSSEAVLVYENGGYNFKIEGRRKTIYEKKLDNTIIFADISNEGYAVVVTSSDMYVCTLTVYDEKGKELYTRNSVERIVDVSFHKKSTGCCIVTLDAKEGQIVSKSASMSFTDENELWSSESLPTMCIAAHATADGGMFLFGDTECAYYSNEGVHESGYDYSLDLLEAAFSEDRAAMLFENEERRKTSLVLIGGSKAAPVEITIGNSIKHMNVKDDLVYLMTADSLKAYNYSGEIIAEKELSEAYRSFVMMGDYIFLVGYNKIDRININK